MDTAKKTVYKLVLIFATVLLLIPFLYTLILSFKAYKPIQGFVGSPWVGFKNFGNFFAAPHVSSLLINSVKISVSGLVVGGAYVFLSSLAIGSVKKNVLKAIMTAAFCIPAIVPINLLMMIIPREILLKPSFLLQFIVGTTDGLRFSGLILIAALFIKQDILKESFKCSLLFLAIRIAFIFTTDKTFILSVYNPLTYEVLDTFSTYTYRIGMLQNDYSFATVANVIKVLFQLVPAGFAFIVLKNIFENKSADYQREGEYLPFTIVLMVPIAILTAVILKGSSLLPAQVNPLVVKGYFNGLIIALLSAVIMSLISILIAKLARNSGTLGILALLILCLAGDNLIGNYLIIRSIGLVDTPYGVVLQNLSMMPIMAMIFTFIMKKEEKGIKDLSLFIIGFVVAFAWFWGDTMSSMIMLRNREAFPLSLILREVTMMGNNTESAAFTTLSYILIPVVVAALGIIAGAYLMKSKSE